LSSREYIPIRSNLHILRLGAAPGFSCFVKLVAVFETARGTARKLAAHEQRKYFPMH
jgi:hypothetical protein